MVLGVPILSRDDQVKTRLHAISHRHDSMTVSYSQSSAGDKIVL